MTHIVFVNRRGRNKRRPVHVRRGRPGHDADHARQRGGRRASLVAERARHLHTSFVQGYPSIVRIAVGGGALDAGRVQGAEHGAAVSPDGGQVALILSYQGNPELYTARAGQRVAAPADGNAARGWASPCWSPDGRSIVYVSDITKTPQLYIVDVGEQAVPQADVQGV
jgi:TolB protein